MCLTWNVSGTELEFWCLNTDGMVHDTDFEFTEFDASRDTNDLGFGVPGVEDSRRNMEDLRRA